MFATLPVVNQSLQFLMIREDVVIEGLRRDLIRFPGTLMIVQSFAMVPLPSNPLGLTVQIPRVLGRDATGRETIDWVNVLEEVRADNSFVAANTGSFSMSPSFPGQESGLAAVRINLPFQSVMLGGFFERADGSGSSGAPIRADGVLAVLNPEDQLGRLAIDAADTEGVYGGEYGLGSLNMLGGNVRPFRRLITSQSMFRREVFQ